VALSKEITRLDKSNVKLSLTIPRDEVRTKYNDLLNDYCKDIRLPGFRKGKVPREVLVRKLGNDLQDEILGRIIESALTEVFEEGNLGRKEKPIPYSNPTIEEKPKFDLDADLTLSFVYDVLPDVPIGRWKGLEVEVPDVRIEDEDIARELEELRERNAIVRDRNEGDAARKNDVVTVNYREIGENGETLPNSERQDFVFTLGTGYNIYQFDDEITGMKKGETREFVKTWPGDYPESSLAGQTKKLGVTLVSLKEKELPVLDDDFAQDVDEKYKTLEDLKNSIRERLDKNLELRMRETTISKLLEKIMGNTPVIIPESMISSELEGRWLNLARRFNIPVEELIKRMSKSGRTVEEIQDEWRPAAENALHSRLIVETLLEEQKIENSEEEEEKELETMAGEYGISLEEIKKYYEDEGMMERLGNIIRERKLYDLLLAENTIKKGNKTKYLEFATNNG
jgi:trigger factor